MDKEKNNLMEQIEVRRRVGKIELLRFAAEHVGEHLPPLQSS
jgi:hypothetical protein